MNSKQKKEFMEFTMHLLNRNVDNKITPELATGIFNRIGSALDEITKPGQVAPNDASIDLDKMPFPS